MGGLAGKATLDVAVAGLGNVAESHLTAYRAMAGVRIVGATEPRSERRAEICERYHVRGYADLAELFSDCVPDVVCILTPASTHREIAEQCAVAGANVLCEKPMASSLNDAIAMQLACMTAGVQLFYGSSYRFLPAVKAAHALIRSGEIGTVRLIIEQVVGGAGANAHVPLSPIHYPRGGPGGGGYGLVDHGIHMLDIFPWLCDSPVIAALGRGDRTGHPARSEFAMLSMASGALGTLLYDGSTWSAGLPNEGIFSAGQRWVDGRGWVGQADLWDPSPGSIYVHGEEGALRIFPYGNQLILNKKGALIKQTLCNKSTPWHFGEQLREFERTLRTGEKPSVPAEIGIHAMRVLEALYRSEAIGAWQPIDVK